MKVFCILLIESECSCVRNVGYSGVPILNVTNTEKRICSEELTQPFSLLVFRWVWRFKPSEHRSNYTHQLLHNSRRLHPAHKAYLFVPHDCNNKRLIFFVNNINRLVYVVANASVCSSVGSCLANTVDRSNMADRVAQDSNDPVEPNTTNIPIHNTNV